MRRNQTPQNGHLLRSTSLQALRCESTNPFSCGWVTQGIRSHTKYANQQVPVHYECHTNVSTSWRTYVTVKVIISGWFDKKDTDTNVKSVNCRPAI